MPDEPDAPDDRPRPRRRRDDDESDDRPRARREDDDDRPRARRRDDDEYEDRPRSRRRDDDEEYDDYDDRPRRRRRPAADPFDDPAMGLVIPVNTNGLAIAAGYLGLISVLCLPAPFALLLGILALRQLRRNPKQWGWGRAIFAVIMGGVGTLAVVGFLVMALIQGAGK